MRQPDGDAIHIEQLEITARVGVPDQERAEPQRLVVCLTLWPVNDFAHLGDDLARTVNYASVARSIREFAGTRHDKLIETLANEIALHLLGAFPIRALRVELRKFVIPASDYVAVIITRERGEATPPSGGT
jgi:FolB domain-containing protein